LATETLTITWLLAFLPSCPQYWLATPTEHFPFFGIPDSSMIHTSMGPWRSISGNAHCRATRRTLASLHGACPTKWSSDWCSALTRFGEIRAAMGSTLLLVSLGSSRPTQYFFNGSCRSAWPMTPVRRPRYLSNRSLRSVASLMFASSFGGEHNTIYEPVKFCDAVVLGVVPRSSSVALAALMAMSKAMKRWCMTSSVS